MSPLIPIWMQNIRKVSYLPQNWIICYFLRLSECCSSVRTWTSTTRGAGISLPSWWPALKAMLRSVKITSLQCSGSEINNFGSGSRSGSSNWKSRISDPDSDLPGSGSFCELVMVKKSFQFWLVTRHKWVEILQFFKKCVWNYDEFFHFLVHF